MIRWLLSIVLLWLVFDGASQVHAEGENNTQLLGACAGLFLIFIDLLYEKIRQERNKNG